MLTEEQFNDLQQKLVSAWHKGNFGQALAEAQVALDEGTPAMKGQCLFYSGWIKKDQGAVAETMEDWTAGLSYAQDGTFLRYQLEHSLGQLDENLNKSQEANLWYRHALRTCANGDDFSGHQALTGFLRVNGKEIAQEDRLLIVSVIEKSWRVLELPGKPTLTSLADNIGQIDSGFREMMRKARDDS